MSSPAEINNINFDISSNIIDGSISVFVLLLIIFGNFLGELMPCKVREALSNNMLLKHFLGYLTLLFFAVLTIYEQSNINIIISSFFVYIYFLFLSKTHYKLWIIIVFLLGIAYFLHIYKMTTKDVNKYDENNIFTISRDEVVHAVPSIQLGLIIISVILTVVGFTIYLFQKRKEYSNKFSYLTFFLGKPHCKNKN